MQDRPRTGQLVLEQPDMQRGGLRVTNLALVLVGRPAHHDERRRAAPDVTASLYIVRELEWI